MRRSGKDGVTRASRDQADVSFASGQSALSHALVAPARPGVGVSSQRLPRDGVALTSPTRPGVGVLSQRLPPSAPRPGVGVLSQRLPPSAPRPGVGVASHLLPTV